MYRFSNNQVNVPLKVLKTNKGFVEDNRTIHEEIFQRDAHRPLYGDDNGEGVVGGLKYVGTKIVRRSDIDKDVKYGAQHYRAAANEEVDNIERSIREKGYNLNEVPPAVMITGPDKYILLEGRTRDSMFDTWKFETVLVDTYEHVDKNEDPGDFCFFMNTYGNPKGFATNFDAKVYFNSVVDRNIDQLRELDRQQLIKWLRQKQKRINFKLTNSEADEVIHYAQFRINGAQPTVSFKASKADGVRAWLTEHGYVDTDTYRYVPITSEEHNILKYLARQLKNNPEDTREIRAVVWSGTIAASNPVKDWTFRNLEVFDRYKQFLENISAMCFDDAPIVNSRFKLYGCVPQVQSLAEKYPMNKIVKFEELV